ELNVLQPGDALSHQLQHRVAEALDAGLNLADARRAKQPYLFLLQIRLRFVEQADAQATRRKLREKVLEVPHVQDVVDDPDVTARILRDEQGQFVQRATRRLAAKGHGRAVQAAKRTVHTLAPPAAARCFE